MAKAYKKLLKDVNLDDPKILELGSGSGANSLKIAEIFKTRDITLVDFNESALEVSKRLKEASDLDLDIKYLNQNILELDLDRKFDIVHSEGLIEHFYGEDRVAAFKSHIDFCAQDGFIIIFVPRKSIQYDLFKWFYQRIGKWVWDEEPLATQELYELCAQFDLEIVKEHSFPLSHQIGILAKKYTLQ